MLTTTSLCPLSIQKWDNVESVLDLTNSVYYITPKMKLRIKPLFPQYANTTVFLRVNNRLVHTLVRIVVTTIIVHLKSTSII